MTTKRSLQGFSLILLIAGLLLGSVGSLSADEGKDPDKKKKPKKESNEYNSLFVDFMRARSVTPAAIECQDLEYPVFGVDVKIFNLGPNINSEYSDYNPIIDKKENFMLYTSRRAVEEDEERDIDGQYFEKMFISHRVDGVYDEAHEIATDDSIFGRLPQN